MSRFNYSTHSINAFQITTEVLEAKDGSRKPINVDYLTLPSGERYITSERFWSSLCSRYANCGVNMNMFTSGLFTHEEVFTRLATKMPDEKKRNWLTIDTMYNVVLGVTSVNKPVCKYDELLELLDGFQPLTPPCLLNDIRTSNHCGVVVSRHKPRLSEQFAIGNDTYTNEYSYKIPIDGYGKPTVYLTLTLNKNGRSIPITSYSPHFKSELNIGKDENVVFTLTRALESYSNEEGFIAFRERLESAKRSWASIGEASDLLKAIIHTSTGITDNGQGALYQRDNDDIDLSDNIMVQKALNIITGDVAAIYGLVHVDALSRKKMERLPVKCSVYDLIVFAGEVLAYYTDEKSSTHMINSWLSNTISDEYDIEDSIRDMPEFDHFTLRANAIVSED